MRLRHPRLSSVMSWIITIALTLAPVMGQSTADTNSARVEPHKEEPAELAKDSQNPIVDISVLPELPLAATAPEFPDVSRNSTPAAAPIPAPQTKPGGNVEPGGKSKWTILAALIIAGAVVGVILLLRGFGGGDDKSKPATPTPTGTIITAGTPSVNVPGH
jgi:hypothetical protein